MPGTGLGILRHDRIDSFAVTPPKDRAGQRRARLLVLAKSSIRSTVYRPKFLDYVAVRTFSQETGEVTGEYRFLGLYTQAAFTESITRIPVLRRKLDGVLAAAGLPEDSHDGKALIEILEGYPREELFEISTEQLAPIARAVLGLGERKQVRLFLRPDAYGRYVSCLVYLPRDRYTTKVRLRVQEILRSALGGDSVDYSAMVGNSALARLHVVVYAAPGRPLAVVDQAELQARIAAAVRSWDEDLAAEAERQLGPARAAALLSLTDGIPEAYKTDTTPVQAVEDLAVVLRLQEGAGQFDIRLSISPNGPWRLRLFRLTPITLSDVLPQLQHMGLEVLDEHPYEFARQRPLVLDLRLRPSADPERAAHRGRGHRRLHRVRVHARVGLARPDRGRRLQRPGARRRADLAAGRAAARVRAVPAPGGNPVQPGLPAAGAALQPGDHPPAGPLLRVPLRPGLAGRRRGALHARSARSSEARSMT